MDTTTRQTIYTETTGCTVILGDQRGTLTELHHEGVGDHRRTVGAFVRLDGPVDAEGRCIAQGPMLYVTLGKVTGNRGQDHEVTGWRVVTRDDFDHIVGIEDFRASCGWRETVTA